MDTKVPLSAADSAAYHSDKLSIEDGRVAASEGADAALQFSLGEAVTFDEATNRRIRRTIDWHLLPWMFCLFTIQYFDKTALSYAAIMGLNQDANLTQSEYAWYI